MILVNIQYFFVVLRVNDLSRYLISFVSLCTLRANTNVSSYLNDLLARSIPLCGWILNDVALKVRQSWIFFFQNERMNSTMIYTSGGLLFALFWKKLKKPKICFEINWPLVRGSWNQTSTQGVWLLLISVMFSFPHIFKR